MCTRVAEVGGADVWYAAVGTGGTAAAAAAPAKRWPARQQAHPIGLFMPPRTTTPSAKYCSRAAVSSVRGARVPLPLRTGYPLTDELIERVALQEVGEGGAARRGGGQCQHRQEGADRTHGW